MVKIFVKDYGEIDIELDYKNAPNTAANFAKLAKDGFYNGLIFHRIIKGFMIQGGDPHGTGAGGPGFFIKGEFASNGHPNALSHKRGVISMARTSDPNTAGSQFFICDKNDEFLDGQYAAFGKVVNGLEVVDAIAKQPKNRNDRPLSDIVIEKMDASSEPDMLVERQ